MKKKLMKYSMNMYDLATELEALAESANETLSALQHNVFREKDIPFNNPMSINETPVVKWGKSAVTSKAFRFVTDIILE